MRKSLLITPSGTIKSVTVVFDSGSDHDISKVLNASNHNYDGESLLEMEDIGYKLCVFISIKKPGVHNRLAEELYGRLKNRYNYVPVKIYGNMLIMDDEKSLENKEWDEIRNYILNGPKKLGLDALKKDMNDFMKMLKSMDENDED